MLKKVEIPCPCDGCEKKVVDDYGYMCDLACGRRSHWISEKAGVDIQLEADIYEYGKLEAINVKLYADLKEHKRLIKELNEDWKATLKVASNKKLSGILLDKEQEVNNVKKD